MVYCPCFLISVLVISNFFFALVSLSISLFIHLNLDYGRQTLLFGHNHLCATLCMCVHSLYRVDIMCFCLVTSYHITGQTDVLMVVQYSNSSLSLYSVLLSCSIYPCLTHMTQCNIISVCWLCEFPARRPRKIKIGQWHLPENGRSHTFPCAWIISATESIGLSFFSIFFQLQKI